MQSDLPDRLWTRAQVKDVLKHPVRILHAEPYASWVARRGGLAAVRAYLQQCQLPAVQRKLLTTLLEQPGEVVASHLQRLAIGRASYFRQLDQLYDILADHLNAWVLPAKLPHASWTPPPKPLTSFIGRETWVHKLVRLLQQPEVRLITITGPGGTGKTRLCLQALADYGAALDTNICFVSLESVTDPKLVPATLVQALGVADDGQQPAMVVLRRWLPDQKLLLVLDSFEHVHAAAPLLSDILTVAPQVKVLVTSREMLRLYGEIIIDLPPLELPSGSAPNDDAANTGSEAVRLFVARAQAVKPDLPRDPATLQAISQICRALDGLPLAIELAAFQVRYLPPALLLEQMPSRLALCATSLPNLPLRQRGLRALLSWSYDLLTAEEQILFRRLGLLLGGWTIDAAAACCTDILPASQVQHYVMVLFDKHLIVDDASAERLHGRRRFKMLDVIREFAFERLDRHEEARHVRHKLIHFYLTLAEQASAGLSGPDQIDWLNRLQADYHHVRQALRWTLDEAIVANEGLRFGVALVPFWRTTSFSEGAEWLETLLAASPDAAPLLRAQAMHGLGRLLMKQGELHDAWDWLSHAHALYASLGEQRSVIEVIQVRANIAGMWGDWETALELDTESIRLAESIHDDLLITEGLLGLAIAMQSQQNLALARTYFERALELGRQTQNLHHQAIAFNSLGEIMRYEHDFASATAYYLESMAIFTSVNNQWGIAMIHHNLGQVERMRSAYQSALSHFLAALQIHCDQRSKKGIAECLAGIAEVHTQQGKPTAAARLCGSVDSLLEEMACTLDPLDQQEYLAMVSELQAELGASLFGTHHVIGRHTDLDRVVRSLLTEREVEQGGA